MKTSLLALFSILTLALSSSANECSQYEAQFSGTVINVEKDFLDQNQVDCYFQISFTGYSTHALCPLDFSKVYGIKHLANSCSTIKEGSQMSGVLVEKDGYIYID